MGSSEPTAATLNSQPGPQGFGSRVIGALGTVEDFRGIFGGSS